MPSLPQEWKKEKANRSVSYASVFTKGEFDAVDPDTTDYLMGKRKTTTRKKREMEKEKEEERTEKKTR